MTSVQFSPVVPRAYILAWNLPCTILRALSSLPVTYIRRRKIMYHGRLGCFWIWCHIIMSDCKYRYMNERWCDDEWDKQAEHMQGDLFTNGHTKNACEEICSQMGEHVKHAKLQEKEQHAHATSSEHQDHSRLCTPYHAEAKLWYTKSTSITQQHCSLTWTSLTAWTYQICLVKSCHESSQPHH